MARRSKPRLETNDGDCPACVSGYHNLCSETLNDGTECDCAYGGHL